MPIRSPFSFESSWRAVGNPRRRETRPHTRTAPVTTRTAPTANGVVKVPGGLQDEKLLLEPNHEIARTGLADPGIGRRKGQVRR